MRAAALVVGLMMAQLGFSDAATRVETTEGPIVGAFSDETAGVRVYKGIPYAAAPVGELRWRAPAPHPPWHEAREAVEFGTPCWQRHVTGIYSRGPVPRSEDCLYLNVWTASSAGDKAPVMLWIHGGSFEIGHGHLEWYDGTDTARDSIVLVTINYRLGPFGFFAHPWLEGEDANGNQGLLDQVAALRWVQANIAAFGGDPDNVTIFGESAGSASVCYLQASPLAKGLFAKAIGQSAGCFAPHPTLTEDSPTGAPSGYKMGRKVVEHIGAKDLDALRAMDAETLFAALEASDYRVPYPAVYVDGNLFPAQMRALHETGKGSQVPVLVGANADEETALFGELPDVTRGELVEQLRTESPANADALIAAYASEMERGPRIARDRMLSHRLFAWEARAWARSAARTGQPAYLYHFTYVPELPEYGRELGAFHAAEIAYVFNNLDRTDWAVSIDDREVARILSGYWRNFARSGDPNGERLPQWPLFDEQNSKALELGARPKVIDQHLKDKLDVIDAFYASKRGG
ncbi:MAG: carboxylesterase family protein [Gammaproteobacteria bacterium]|nr:carboxylesterase family protein [Gammaproteobacteria bacterium]